ncbi:MAG: hypothetical protein OSJ65_07250 [Bacilli bacterium]|nr:hypothetical protein [Bacilli bacterium]
MAQVNAYESFLNKSNFYTQEEVAETFGQSIRKNIASSLVIKKEELFLEYKETDLITVNPDEKKQVSKKLIHDLLTDEGMNKYLQTNLDNDLGIAARIDFIIDKDTIVSIKLTRKDFITALNQMSSELSQKELMRSAVIKSSCLLFSCEQKYRNTNHRIYVNDKCLEIPVSILINILSCSDETFTKFLDGSINYGYAKDILAYALVDFVERERILIKYVLPEELITRYKNIKNYSLIDFESINKNRIKNDTNEFGESIIEKIEMSEQLNAFLNAEIDPKYSKFEKSIYYYIKLCEVFSLDDDYYLKISPSIHETHEETENINKKNQYDNKITMYEFFAIFASILADLKMDYTLDQELMNGNDFGNKKITFKYGEYLVAINSLAVPEKSDIINAKINDKLVNIVSLNKNQITKKKFNELVAKIYADIQEKKRVNKRFKDSVAAYKQTMQSSKISTVDKLYILLKEITRLDLKGMDMVGYEKKLFKTLFSSNTNISINILARQNKQTNYLTPVTIISVIDHDCTYFIIDEMSKEVLRSVSIEELTSLLSDNVYYYVDNTEIPGISKYVGDKIVR